MSDAVTGVEVTTADPGEVDTVADQWVELARGQREHGSHLRPETNRVRVRERFARYSARDELLVARPSASAADIVGFVSFRVRSNRYETECERGLVENLYVVPDWRNQEVGSELLAAAERRLSERGVDVVSLEAMASNASARQFYRRHGYEPHRVEFEKRLER